MGIFSKYLSKNGDGLYVLFRILAGALFFMIGFQKILGLFGMSGAPAQFGTLVWFAGIFEIMIGLGLVLGVLTRLASLFGIIMMVVAYFLGHVSTGEWNPLVNMGIPAIMFGLVFLITFVFGAKKFSLEQKLLKREIF